MMHSTMLRWRRQVRPLTAAALAEAQKWPDAAKTSNKLKSKARLGKAATQAAARGAAGRARAEEREKMRETLNKATAELCERGRANTEAGAA